MTLHYFIDTYPVPLVPLAVQLVIGAIAVGAAASIALWIAVRRMRHNPPKKRVLKRLFRWFVLVTIATLLLFFLRQQRVYILAMPLIALAVYASLVAWLIYAIVVTMKTLPQEERLWRESETRKKYLP